MKPLNESWEMYSQIMNKLDEVIDLVEQIDPTKISLVQIQDMEEYVKHYAETVDDLKRQFVSRQNNGQPMGSGLPKRPSTRGLPREI